MVVIDCWETGTILAVAGKGVRLALGSGGPAGESLAGYPVSRIRTAKVRPYAKNLAYRLSLYCRPALTPDSFLRYTF